MLTRSKDWCDPCPQLNPDSLDPGPYTYRPTKIHGVNGSFCAPECGGGGDSDCLGAFKNLEDDYRRYNLPPIRAKPQCILSTCGGSAGAGDKNVSRTCALICDPDDTSAGNCAWSSPCRRGSTQPCAGSAVCRRVPNAGFSPGGICTFD